VKEADRAATASSESQNGAEVTTKAVREKPGEVTRHGMIKAVAAGAIGVAAASLLGRSDVLAATPPDQQPSFKAIGPAPDSGTGFDAGPDSGGTPIFSAGVSGSGTTFGVGGNGPNIGVFGSGGYAGVSAYSDKGRGVLASSAATLADGGQGVGVVGWHTQGTGAGVAGYSLTGSQTLKAPPARTGVYGLADFYGVRGEGATGVSGLGRNGGIGVYGKVGAGTAVSGVAAAGVAIKAQNSSDGHAAVLVNNGGSAAGVRSTSKKGYGAELAGGGAAVRLVPRPSKGHPKSGFHQLGEIVVDSAGKLFLCVGNGTPGTWREVVVK
jgi:hypothetical protein